MKAFLNIIAEGQTLTQPQAEDAMRQIMRGESSPEVTAGFLLGLRSRGESLDELTGFVRVMREYAVPVACPDPDAIDIVGTGGDGSGTFNISTAASFVCAGAGVTVAKHGNRSVSSKCGSADVLSALGVKAELGKEGVEFCLREAGIAFLFAPYFHPAMRHVMPVRRALGVRTCFNILGPMCNPAGVQRYLVGAFDASVAQMMAGILARLGAVRALTVHSEDGLDEFSIAAPTAVFSYDAEVNDDFIPTIRSVIPEEHGLPRAPLSALKGGDAETNAAILRGLFEGTPGPARDVVVLNAAYGLHASGRFPDLDACFDAAQESLDTGAARAALHRLAEASHDAPA